MVTVLADPRLRYSTCESNETNIATNEVTDLEIDQIAAQSHLTKCCGPVEDWEEIFKIAVSY